MIRWSHVEHAEGQAGSAAAGLGAVDAALSPAGQVWRYRATGHGALLAGLATLQRLLGEEGTGPLTRIASGPGSNDRVLIVEEGLDDELLRDLLTALSDGSLPPGPPAWGARVEGGGSASRNPLARYRGRGPVLRASLRGGGEGLSCELFPLTLTALAGKPSALRPPEKRGEKDGNLDGRAGWFGGRSDRRG